VDTPQLITALMHSQTIPVIAYYDLIAGVYNEHMTDSDRQVRGKVASVFASYVAGGNVLDFGGGTGLDLPWLLGLGYHVFFLEPSAGMRKLARQEVYLSLGPGMPVFLDKDTDIGGWSPDHLPFTEKMQGILADFAVLNCLADLKGFFQKMSLVSQPGAHVVICVLDLPWLAVLRAFGLRAALQRLLWGSVTVPNSDGGIRHKTYIRSMRRYRRAAGRYFRPLTRIRLQANHFSLLIFKK
jgi:SAM-dependent methyltransferase